MLPFKNIHFQRLKKLIILCTLTGLAFFLFLDAASQSLHLYLTPSEIKSFSHAMDFSRPIRVGGLVKKNSLSRNDDEVSFQLIDEYNGSISVFYKGSLPTLFSEGQGAIIDGVWDNEKLIASKVLVKHDENYYPPKVKDDYTFA